MVSRSSEPRLFSVSTGDPRQIRYENRPWIEVDTSAFLYYEQYSQELESVLPANALSAEPPDQPPFELSKGRLPELLTSGWSSESFQKLSLLTESSKLSTWNRFRHLESELISEQALAELNELTDGSVRSIRSFNITQEEQRWHLIDFDTEGGSGRAPVVRSLCNPAIPEDVDLAQYVSEQIANGQHVELAFGSWMNKDNRFLDFGTGNKTIVTEAFKDRWLATEFSKQLRDSPYEQDLWFTPSNGGFPDEVTYTWVDNIPGSKLA